MDSADVGGVRYRSKTDTNPPLNANGLYDHHKQLTTGNGNEESNSKSEKRELVNPTILEGRSSLVSTPVSYYSSDEDDEKDFQTPPITSPLTPTRKVTTTNNSVTDSVEKKISDEDTAVAEESINVFSVYGIVSTFFGLILSIFFRNIGYRGLHKIPKKGPVIFVVAPHCNQFVDPMVLMHIIPRPVYFLIAAKSMGRKIIGFFGRLAKAIPVIRPQDLMVKGGKKAQAKPILDSQKLSEIAKTHASSSSLPESEFISGKVLFIENFDLTMLKMPENALGWQISLSSEGPIVSADAPGITTHAIQEIYAKAGIVLLRKPITEFSLVSTSQFYFNLLPVIDQSSTYEYVYERLLKSHCIGIFPEGGSHDRAEMLPLKAGVTIMALGAMSKYPDLSIRIVPCGLTYFHPHKFRSRAMVEFGKPITISRQLLKMYQAGGESKRNTCSQLLGDIREALWNVTVNAPDYETLQLIQAVKRLYRPDGKRLSTFQELELTRRFLKGYMTYREDDRVKAALIQVQLYNRLLQVYGLKDHQVRKTDISPRRIAFLLVMRIGMLLVALVLSLPGILLNLPIVIIADRISKAKAKEALAASSVKIAGRDVLASWKLMVSLVLLPSLYVFYTFIFYWWQCHMSSIVTFKEENSSTLNSSSIISEEFIKSLMFLFFMLPIFSFSSVILVERGMDVVRSLSTLVLALTNPERASELRKTRRHLKKVIVNLVEELGPTLFEDFYEHRIIDSAGGIVSSNNAISDPPSRYESSTGNYWRNTFSGIVLRTLAGFRDDTLVVRPSGTLFSPSEQPLPQSSLSQPESSSLQHQQQQQHRPNHSRKNTVTSESFFWNGNSSIAAGPVSRSRRGSVLYMSEDEQQTDEFISEWQKLDENEVDDFFFFQVRKQQQQQQD